MKIKYKKILKNVVSIILIIGLLVTQTGVNGLFLNYVGTVNAKDNVETQSSAEEAADDTENLNEEETNEDETEVADISSSEKIVSYVDISGEEDTYVDDNPTVTNRRLSLSHAVINGRQVKRYYTDYNSDDYTYSGTYFARQTNGPTFTDAQWDEGVTVYVEYEPKDTVVWYFSYRAGVTYDYTNIDNAKSYPNPAPHAGNLNKYIVGTYIPNNKPKAMTYVYMGDFTTSVLNQMKPDSSFTKRTKSADIRSQFTTADTENTLTGTTILPSKSTYDGIDVTITSTYNGLEFGGNGVGIEIYNGYDSDKKTYVENRELMAYSDITIKDFSFKVMDTDATGFKWLLVENNGHKVDMSDNVTFVDSSNNSVDYKVYNCNNLNNGLTVNFVDESGHILGTNENVELITSSKSGLYFRMENPAVTGDYKYELNGVDVTTNINNQQGIEMVDTYEEGATSDTVEITVYPREVETVTKNIKFVDAENPTNVVTEKNVEMEVDTTDYLLYDMPTTIEGRQIGYVVLEDGSALFGGGKNSAIAKKEDVEDEIVIKVHYEDVITYYVGNITYPVNERDGLSPYTAFNSFDQIREELRDKNYTFKDKIRIVLMNSTARTGRFVELAQYALGEEEYSYTQDSSMVLTGNGKDANAQYGTNALFYAGEDEEMPEITFTSKHNNINYNSGLIFEDRAVLVYNKITFENLTMSMQPPENASYNTYTEIMFYAQGNDLKISENVTVNLKGAGNNNTNGIERNYPLITLILGTWGSANKQYHRTVKGNGTLNPTLTINSGRWGRIIGGARMGIIGTEEEPYNPTINIGGSADVSIIMGAQTESYMYGSPTINIRENANVGKLIAATQGYDNAAFGEHTYSNATCTTGYSDESGGIPRTVNIYGGTVNNLYGASIARNTTSVADFGDTVINVMDDPEDENSGNYKATINNLYGGPAAGVMFGDITINISKANSEINNIWGAGGGASDLINKSLLGTYDSSSNLYYEVINPGNIGYLPGTAEGENSSTSAIDYDDIKDSIIGGHITVNMTGGVVTGNLFGGGRGFDYSTVGLNYYSVAQVWNGTEVNISGNAVVKGNVFGGGDGFETSDLIAKVYPETKVNIGEGAVIEGNVYGGGNNAYVDGECSVVIDGATVNGDIFGAGAKSGISTDTSVIIKNNANVKNVYGGGENGDVPGSTSVEIYDSTAEKVIGGGLYGNVKGNTSVLLENSKAAYVHGGGYGAEDDSSSGNVEGTATVILRSSEVTEHVAGGGEHGNVGAVVITIEGNSEIHGEVVGGGINGNVTGSIEVTITESKLYSGVIGGGEYGNVGGSTKLTINDAVIEGTTNGGGKLGNVEGDTTVIVGGSSQLGNLYGGGVEGNVSGSSNVILDGSAIVGDVYGGGKGVKDDFSKGEVSGGTSVRVLNGSSVTGNIYGGGEYGVVKQATEVIINDSKVDGDVFGGGTYGYVKDGTNVTISNSTVNNAYGGGAYGDVLSGGTKITVDNNSVTNSVAGGGLTSNISGGTDVVIEDSTVQASIVGASADGQVNGDVNITILQTESGKTNISGVIIGGGISGVVNGDSYLTITNKADEQLKIDATVYDGGYGDTAITYGSSHITIGDKNSENASVVMGKDPYGNQYKFYLGGGSGSVEGDTYVDKDGSDIIFSFSETNPQRDTETFKGWYLIVGENDEIVQYDPEKVYGNTKWASEEYDYLFNKTDTSDTLDANGSYIFTLDWALANYTIKYDSNTESGVTGTMSDSLMFINHSRQLRKNAFETTSGNNHFIGWNTKSDGSGISFTDRDLVNLDLDTLKEIMGDAFISLDDDLDYVTTMHSLGTLTLYAMWSDVSTTVKANGALAMYGDNAYITSELINKADGYDYTYQWYKKVEGGYEKIDGATDEHLTIIGATDDDDGNIYRVEVTMTGNTDDTKGDEPYVIVSNDAELTIIHPYVLYYDQLSVTEERPSGLIATQSEGIEYNKTISHENLLQPPSHDGYVFTGWYTEEECKEVDKYDISKAYDDSNYSCAIKGITRLYAGWRKIGTVEANESDPYAQIGQGSEFYLVGASVRTFATENVSQGLRFVTRISKSLLSDIALLNEKNGSMQPKNASDKNVGYGTVGSSTIYTDTLEGNIEKNITGKSMLKGTVVVPASTWYMKVNKGTDKEYLYYTMVISGMPQTYYDTPMVARPYITYYDANGNLRTYYYTEEQKWSDETKTGFSGGGYAVSYIKAIETMLDIIKNDSEHIVFGESYPYEDYEEALEFMQKIYDTYIEQNGK